MLLLLVAVAAWEKHVERMLDPSRHPTVRNDACYGLRGEREPKVVAAMGQALREPKLRACAAARLREAGAAGSLRAALKDAQRGFAANEG